MGEHLADKLLKHIPYDQIDVVIPIPDSSRPSAMQLAQRIGVPYREGFVKNRYIGRTFIMPGQATRARSVRQKLNTVAQEFKGKRRNSRASGSCWSMIRSCAARPAARSSRWLALPVR